MADARQLSDNNRSCAYTVIYWGEQVNVPIRKNGVNAGICVLYQYLAHSWVFAITVQSARVQTDVFVIYVSNGI